MKNTQKKILLLGGLRYLIPVIEAAHKLGYYVITCDYIPDNIAHKYSDEYHNISILDEDAVLELAKKLEIDGIMSFAVDPGVITAAYVAEQMGLPGLPSSSVKILQNKALFRNFLTQNGFIVPKAKGYTDIDEALNDGEYYDWPIIIKPVDSAGSKGVSRVDSKEFLRSGIEQALEFSLSKEFIIEEFIEQEGCSSDSDCFSVNGILKFVSFSNQYFDAQADNPYVPSAYSWSSTMNKNSQNELERELQRLVTLLNLGTSIYNVETRIGVNGKAYIMEMSPRGGGNRISEILHIATGVNLIENAVRAAVGDPILELESPVFNNSWAMVVLHSDKEGEFVDLNIEEKFAKEYVSEIDLWITKGDHVNSFRGANDTIGTLVLKFKNEEELLKQMQLKDKWLKVIIK